MSDIAVTACKEYTPNEARRAIAEALGATGGLELIKSGMKVVIKANLVSGKHPDTATTTHPVLLAALTEIIRDRGASVIVGDSPGGLFTASWLGKIYKATGLDMCVEAGASLNDDFTHSNGDCGGKVLHEFTYTSYLNDADLIIDFAKLKTHGMMVMSGAVKNMFGAIPGAMKPEYHSRFPTVESFADMLIDIYEYFLPRISLIDAVWGMEGNGPTCGSPRYVGALIASQNGHLADMAAAHIMGIDLEKLPLHAMALKRGLCPEDLSHTDIYGDIDGFVVKDYDLICDASSDFGLVVPRPLAWLSDKVFRIRPQLSGNKCVGCSLCANTCPRGAITMKKGKPDFDYSKCIRCFCCQEFCPKGALRVHRTLIARLING